MVFHLAAKAFQLTQEHMRLSLYLRFFSYVSILSSLHAYLGDPTIQTSSLSLSLSATRGEPLYLNDKLFPQGFAAKTFLIKRPPTGKTFRNFNPYLHRRSNTSSVSANRGHFYFYPSPPAPRFPATIAFKTVAAGPTGNSDKQIAVGHRCARMNEASGNEEAGNW